MFSTLHMFSEKIHGLLETEPISMLANQLLDELVSYTTQVFFIKMYDFLEIQLRVFHEISVFLRSLSSENLQR